MARIASFFQLGNGQSISSVALAYFMHVMSFTAVHVRSTLSLSPRLRLRLRGPVP